LCFIICLNFIVANGQILLQGDTNGLEDGFHKIEINSFICSGLVKNGMQEGAWKTHHPNGQLHVLQYFDNGKLNGLHIELNKNGFIELQADFMNNKLNGKLLRFRTGGRLSLEENYVNDQLHGTKTVYYERGTVQEESEFAHGFRNGNSS
jgi:antitoxin component YwqK of YwqJK toxin-antitoxin module